jgi:hypothetical protein
MEWHKAVIGDLALSVFERYQQFTISGNRLA